MVILPVYAAVLAVFFVYLSMRVIRARRSLQIGLGHAENPVLLRATRVHANFAEYVPYSLLLILIVESLGGAAWLIHTLGCCLILARVSHAYGVSREPENFRYRVFGMVLTFTGMLVSALYILGHQVTHYAGPLA